MRGLALLCLWPCGPIRGQNTFVLPARYASQTGNSDLFMLAPDASQQPVHAQCLWDRSEVPIPFTTPFGYAPATSVRGLVADFQVRSYQPTPSQSWQFDSQTLRNSAATCCWGGNTCRLGNGNWSNGYGYPSPLAPGYPLFVEYPNLLPNAPGAVAFGSLGPGATWSGPRLPVDLTAAGAPGCSWYTSVMLWLPAVCSAAGVLRSPSMMLPNNQQLADTGPYYHQGLVLDATANSLGVVTTVAASFYLGNQVPPNGRTIYRTSDTGGSPTGFLLQQALVAQFRY